MTEKHLYKFGEFTLNVEEHSLTRDGVGIPITPKMFDLLLVFLQNPGRVLGKEFLLQSVWPDSFVEEGNVTFNIRQLRKALGDDTQAPIFIETISRRGYRFLMDVEVSTSEPHRETVPLVSDAPVDASPAIEPDSRARRYIVFSAVAAAVILGVIGVSSWLIKSGGNGSAPILSAPFSSEKLSTTGIVGSAALSPNGKTVVYASRAGNKTSVWLRQLESGTNTQFLPASDDYYFLFEFSSDGQWIYFTRAKQDLDSRIVVFRISIFGGIPEQVTSDTQGWISVSPDGKKISFIRCPRTADDHCSLWMANADGTGDERKLVTRINPIRIGDNQFSPDGRRIAFAAGQSRTGSNDFGLYEVDIETGVEREITSERFFNVKALDWLPSGNELLFTASQIQNKDFRIWHVDAAGQATPLTKDSEAYSIVSLDDEGKQLVSTQIKQNFRVFKFELDDPARRTAIADGSRAFIAPDSRVYFSSMFSGNDEIWAINLDGTEQRQLTNNPGGDGSPMPSADGKIVFFVSNRTGDAQIWRMNPDGSNQVQITQSGGGAPMFPTPDGKLLYYKNLILGNLWSVSLETGEQRQVLDQPKRVFAFSPDGSQVAFEDREGDRTVISVVSMPGGQKIATLELSKDQPRLTEIAFHPDGKTMVYLLSDATWEHTGVYRHPIGGTAQKLGELGSESVSEVSGLTISADGKTGSVVLGDWLHDAVLIRGLR